MNNTPKANRLHIGIFGRRNAGKSSLLNALTRQKVSIVSDIAGTTTDPVEKPMELQPLGPVLFIDTAGIDDEGALGELRAEKSRRVLDRADVALIVVADGVWGSFEQALADEMLKRSVPQIAVFNKSDITTISPDVQLMVTAQSIPVVSASALTGEGLATLRSALVNTVPESFLDAPSIAGDLGTARTGCGAGDAHRQRSTERSAHTSPSSDHTRPSGQRQLVCCGERA